MNRWAWFVVACALAAAGCGSGKSGDGSDADGDLSTDADVDGDADVDTDSDSDTNEMDCWDLYPGLRDVPELCEHACEEHADCSEPWACYSLDACGESVCATRNEIVHALGCPGPECYQDLGIAEPIVITGCYCCTYEDSCPSS